MSKFKMSKHTVGIEIIDTDLRRQCYIPPGPAAYAVVERHGADVKVCATDADLRIDVGVLAKSFAALNGAELLTPRMDDLYQVVITDGDVTTLDDPVLRYQAARAFRRLLAQQPAGRIRVLATSEVAELRLVSR